MIAQERAVWRVRARFRVLRVFRVVCHRERARPFVRDPDRRERTSARGGGGAAHPGRRRDRDARRASVPRPRRARFQRGHRRGPSARVPEWHLLRPGGAFFSFFRRRFIFSRFKRRRRRGGGAGAASIASPTLCSTTRRVSAATARSNAGPSGNSARASRLGDGVVLDGLERVAKRARGARRRARAPRAPATAANLEKTFFSRPEDGSSPSGATVESVGAKLAARVNIGLVATNLRASEPPRPNVSSAAAASIAAASSPPRSASSNVRNSRASSASQYHSSASRAFAKNAFLLAPSRETRPAVASGGSCAGFRERARERFATAPTTASRVSVASASSCRASGGCSRARLVEKHGVHREAQALAVAAASKATRWRARRTASSAATRLLSARRSASPASRATTATRSTRSWSASRVASRVTASVATSPTRDRKTSFSADATAARSAARRAAAAACDPSRSRAAANASRAEAANARGRTRGRLRAEVHDGGEVGVRVEIGILEARLAVAFERHDGEDPPWNPEVRCGPRNHLVERFRHPRKTW